MFVETKEKICFIQRVLLSRLEKNSNTSINLLFTFLFHSRLRFEFYSSVAFLHSVQKAVFLPYLGSSVSISIELQTHPSLLSFLFSLSLKLLSSVSYQEKEN